MIRLSGWFPTLVFVFALFPNVALFPFIQANNQPVAALIIIGSWAFLSTGRVPVNRMVSFFYVLLGLLAVYGFLTLALSSGVADNREPGFVNYAASPMEVVLTFVSYLVGPVIFLFLLYNFRQVRPGAIKAFIILQLAVCVGQMFASGIVGPLFDATMGDLFVGFSSQRYTLGRGVAGTFPEPSHLGRYVVVALGLLLVYRRRSQITEKEFRYYGLATVGLVMMNQSLTGLVILLAWVLGQLVLQWTSGNVVRGGVLTTLMIAGITGVLLAPETVRWGSVADKVSELVAVSGDMNPLDLQIIGGIRLIHMLVGYGSMFLFPLGQGMGSYLHTLPETAIRLGIDIEQARFYRSIVADVGLENVITKPNGYGAQLAYDMGILGLIPVFMLGIAIVRVSVRALPYRASWWTLPLIGLVLVLFYTPTTLPVPWILLALIAFYPEMPPSREREAHPIVGRRREVVR